MRLTQWLFVVCVTLAFPPPGAFAAVEVLVLGETESGHHREFVEALRRGLGERAIDVVFANSEPPWGAADTEVIVTIGSVAARRAAASKPAAPLLHALIPIAGFQALREAAETAGSSALFIDQPLSRHLGLVRLALPRVTSVAFVHAPQTRELLPALRHESAQRGLVLREAGLTDPTALDDTLGQLLDDQTVLLALPDPLVVNSATARNLILGAYLRRTPIVGYSRAFVKAGALMAAHSSPADLGRQTAEMVITTLKTGRPPAPAYPKYFQVAVNYQVARTLGLDIGPEAELARLLRQDEEGADGVGN